MSHSSIPLGEGKYDRMPPIEVIRDFVVIRGDIGEPYAMEQMADVFERQRKLREQEQDLAIAKVIQEMAKIVKEQDQEIFRLNEVIYTRK